MFSHLYSDDQSAFCALRSVCRVCRAASEESLFREITLRGVRDVEAEFLGRVRRHDETVGGWTTCVRVAWVSGRGLNRGVSGAVS